MHQCEWYFRQNWPGANSRNDIFDNILDNLHKLDLFNTQSSPSLFLVYAHESDAGEARADVSLKIIRWLKRVQAKLESDKSPRGIGVAFGNGLNGNEQAVHNILWSQFCLLPKPTNVKSVDKVILCCSETLWEYHQDSLTNSLSDYFSELEQTYHRSQQSSTAFEALYDDMSKVVDKYAKCNGFHHVLTEMAFLRIREKESVQPGIIPIILNGSSEMFEGFPGFAKSTDIWLYVSEGLSYTDEGLHKRFFKLLKRLYVDKTTTIEHFENCYNSCVNSLRGPETSGAEILNTIQSTILATMHRCRDDLAAGIRTSTSKCRTHYVIPSIMNRKFTGREEILERLKQKLFFKKGTPEIALFGLGGVGKTQVALQLATWVKENMPKISIFWAPALSKESFEQACTEIVSELHIRKVSDQESVMETVRRHLSSEAAGQWLLIVDNADDQNMLFGDGTRSGLHEYFPRSEGGVIMLTSRFREIATSFASKDVLELREMVPQEAASLLRNLLIENLCEDQAATEELLKELTWLPLAIHQAAAYMNSNNVPTSRYLEMQRTEAGKARLLSKQYPDTTRYRGMQNAVAATWLISFERIQESSPEAIEILEFMSFMEAKAIPRSMLPWLGSDEQMESAIGTLSGYAFVTKREGGNMFDMHSLVQLAMRLWMKEEGDTCSTVEKTTRHMESVFPYGKWENRDVWRAYLPHAVGLVRNHEANVFEKYEILCKVGKCFLVDGRVREAVTCLEEDVQWREAHYDEDDPDRLYSQHELAIAYQSDGKVKQAVQLLEHVVKIRRNILDESHPARLTSEHNLAGAYLADGQIKQAVKLMNLQEHI
ncbi:hypothetical protein BDV25DRAFT_138934 [Aspergillus avenaceus]|uniref:NB-ARC domain-containing protein n=1 Tax=Aspergillus avenaceus TaxID=36643 RepID=A0A5N6TY45_ASPAV|nr:hypothetical protein BDV25DRAFT_138934 [Aspergillus avenaceus]